MLHLLVRLNSEVSTCSEYSGTCGRPPGSPSVPLSTLIVKQATSAVAAQICYAQPSMVEKKQDDWISINISQHIYST